MESLNVPNTGINDYSYYTQFVFQNYFNKHFNEKKHCARIF